MRKTNRDHLHQYEEREGLKCKAVTQLNSAWKDLFVGIYFCGSLGASVQVCFSFMAKTLENHNKSYKTCKIANEDFLESL